MTRKQFLAALISLPLFGMKAVAEPNKKFFITGLFHTHELNDCTIPAIESYGTDRSDALLNWVKNTRCTVWSEEEYKDYLNMSKEIPAGCDPLPAIKSRRVETPNEVQK